MCDSHKARRRHYEVIFRSCCETNSFSTICPFSSHFPLCTLTAFKQFIAKKRCMQVLDVTEKKCQVRLFLKKRSEYLLEDLWRKKGTRSRKVAAGFHLSFKYFPPNCSFCVCADSIEGVFVSSPDFAWRHGAEFSVPTRGGLCLRFTQPSVSWWLMSDLAQVDFQFKCQISDESFCCKMLFSVAIVWKWIIMNNGIMTSDRTRTWNDFLSWTLLLFLHRCCFRIPPLHCGITQSSFFGVIETLEGRTGCW